MGRGRGGACGLTGGMRRGRGMGRGMGRGIGVGGGRGRFALNPGAITIPGTTSLEPGVPNANQTVIRQQDVNANPEITGRQTTAAVSPLVAVVDSTLCVACGLCFQICPVAAININETAHVDREICTGCGRCVTLCRQGAISLITRKL